MLIRDGGKAARRWGEREIIYLSLHCHHQNDTCIKMGSDESHFNVSVGSHKTVSTNHNLFKEKGEPKRNRAEALQLTSLTPSAKPAHKVFERCRSGWKRMWCRLFKAYGKCSVTHTVRKALLRSECLHIQKEIR